MKGQHIIHKIFSTVFIIWLLTAMCPCVKLLAQDPGHWQLTEADGLPSMTIYRMIQDDKGYIWMATANGICRYDGKAFKTFSKKGLKDGEILKIRQGPKGRIWFRNLSGQLGYINEEKLVLLEEQTKDKNDNTIDFEFSKEHIFIAAINPSKPKGAQIDLNQYRINENGDLTEKTSLLESLYSFTEFINNELKIYTSYSKTKDSELTFYTIDHNTGETNYLKSFRPQSASLFSTELQSSERLIAHSYSENILTEIGANFSQQILQVPNINQIILARKIEENYYILSNNGILFGNKPPFNPNDFFLKNVNCNTLLIDQEKNHWIGTTFDGVIIIPFPYTSHYTTENSQLKNKQTNKIFLDKEKDRLIIGHSGAQISVIEKDHSISNIQLNTSGKITSINIDSNNNYWISSNADSFYGSNLKNLTRSNMRGYKTFIEDSKNNLFFGTSSSIYSPPVQGPNNLDQLIFSRKNSILQQRTYAIFEDQDQVIWFGTSRGLYFKNQDETVQPFLESGKHTPYNISNIYQDQRGVLWIATLGDGVLGIKNKKVIHVFNTTNGFPSNTFRCITVNGSDIWLGSDNGISIYNTDNKSIRKIDKTDGLTSNDINDLALWKDDVWVATNNGLIQMPLNINTYNAVPPSIHLSAIKIWDKDTTLVDSLLLEHGENNLHLEFIGIGYRAQGNISYKYRLSGIDKEWISTKARFVRYPELNPGTYKFEVLSINEDGVTSKSPATLYLKITNPFWKKWWFRLLAVLLIIGGSGLIISSRIQRIRNKEKREHEFKEKMNELKQQALQTQMNPHFIFNSLNAIQQFITTNEREPALIYLSSFAKLVRLIFEHSKRKVISFDEEIEFLQLYLKLEKLRFKEKVVIDFQLDENIESESYQIKVPPLLFQPLIENSFKHGLFHKKNKGYLKINFKKENEYLICTIEDDGVGREKAAQLNHWKTKKYESSGIKTAQERLAILNKIDDPKDISSLEITDLFDDNKNASGTSVRVKIKC